MEVPMQLVPFVLSGLGLATVVLTVLRPQKNTLIALRAVMGLVAVGSVFGVYQHILNNVAFELEIRPNDTLNEVLFDALRGANPLLAPGILALAAILAIAATYYHPALVSRPDRRS
jgi:hypothetical protein